MARGNKNRNNNRLNDTKDRMRLKLAEKKGDTKICLTMIVKNESKNMVRLLDSLKDIIDMISIVDTGSTDNTIEVIYQWSKDNGNIPCKVHQELFQNFAYNRTHSANVAKKTFPEADYLLLSDADFVWDVNVGSKFNKRLLVDHKYLIEQYNKAIKYWNVRLLSTKVDFECIGVTHEYWIEKNTQTSYKGEVRTAKITTLMIDDREDGGCKEDKFDRDERLLKQELLNPTKENKHLLTRYKFYLGQTLKDKGNFLESIEWYQKRVDDKGWEEEVYYATYQIGRCYENCFKLMNIWLQNEKEPKEELKRQLEKYEVNIRFPEITEEKAKDFFEKAESSFLSAYFLRKTRLESLCALVELMRNKGEYKKAYDYAKYGINTKYPHQDSLFIETACYEYKLQLELSIICYYIPEYKEEGGQMIEYLLYKEGIPEEVKNLAMANAKYYI